MVVNVRNLWGRWGRVRRRLPRRRGRSLPGGGRRRQILDDGHGRGGGRVHGRQRASGGGRIRRRLRLRGFRRADSVGEALTDEHLGVVLGAAVAGQPQVLVRQVARLGGALHHGGDVGRGGAGLLLLQSEVCLSEPVSLCREKIE